MKHKILIIEDNEQNLYLLTYILTNQGYEVISARDGRDGIRRAKNEQPDLILLDIQLPEMDGYAVARHLRAEPNIKNAPIVAVTSYAMVGDREKSMAAGCTGYIEKPIEPASFAEQVGKFLKPRGSRE
jgi:CheY-like chemotaxis protein